MRLLLLLLACATANFCQPGPTWDTRQADTTFRNFRFQSGETAPELRLHYTTLGSPQRDRSGRVTNAVLLLHGTGGSGEQFLNPSFAGVLFGKGQLLDASHYFLVLPDNIGHGGSSKPSNGMHARFPHYDYGDMVQAQYRLLTETLGVDHLRLVLGTSMGCMHAWMWGEQHPEFVDTLMPLACLPVPIAGRNRVWRKAVMDSIRFDPGWQGGEYRAQPYGLRSAMYLLLVAGSAPLAMQRDLSTPAKADAYLAEYLERRLPHTDANDLLYQVDASRSYDPSRLLETIRAHVMYINSADDFINPPELGIAERESRRVPQCRFVLLPISERTRGHGTHTLAAVWQQYLAELLDSGAHSTSGALHTPAVPQMRQVVPALRAGEGSVQLRKP